MAEKFFLDVGRDSGAVVAHLYLHHVAKVTRHHFQHRPEPGFAQFYAAFLGGIEPIDEQVQNTRVIS